jgi:hypothetical protein
MPVYSTFPPLKAPSGMEKKIPSNFPSLVLKSRNRYFFPHTDGGFGVPFNCVTKDAAFYATTSRFVSFLGTFSQERQRLWLPDDDLQDSSSWKSSPLVLLRNIHANLLTNYDYKEVCAPSQSQGNVGAIARPGPQDGVPQ